MKTNIFYTHRMLPGIHPEKTAYIIIIAAFFGICFAITKQQVATQKRDLSLLLDSLEMLKQQRKRNGESFGELDRRCMRVRDSIDRLKREVEKLSQQGVLPPAQTSEKWFDCGDIFLLLKKISLLDWMIIGLGIVAFIAFIFLIIGVFRAFRRRPGYRNADKHNRRPKQVKPGANRFSSTSVSPGNADIDNESINSLQRRVSREYKKVQRFSSHPPPESNNELGGGERDEQLKGESINDKVLRAASRGLDVGQISKRFHISADQVSLILRLARNKKREK